MSYSTSYFSERAIYPDIQQVSSYIPQRGRAHQGYIYMPYDSQPSKWPVERWVQVDKPVLYAGVQMGLKEAFFGKGNFICNIIPFVIFLLQQWGGQNLVE